MIDRPTDHQFEFRLNGPYRVDTQIDWSMVVELPSISEVELTFLTRMVALEKSAIEGHSAEATMILDLYAEARETAWSSDDLDTLREATTALQSGGPSLIYIPSELSTTMGEASAAKNQRQREEFERHMAGKEPGDDEPDS